MNLELRRNVFHLVMGVVIGLLVLQIGKKASLLLFSIALLLGVFLSEYLKDHSLPLFSFFIRRFEREGQRPGKGVITFFVGSLVVVSFLSIRTAFISIIIVSFLDSFATIVGKAFHRFKLYKDKTLTGFLAGYLSSLAVTAPLVPLKHILLTCLAGSLAELYLPYDNVSIPIVAGVTLEILSILI